MYVCRVQSQKANEQLMEDTTPRATQLEKLSIGAIGHGLAMWIGAVLFGRLHLQLVGGHKLSQKNWSMSQASRKYWGNKTCLKLETKQNILHVFDE